MALTNFQRDALKRLADNRRMTDARELGLPEYLQRDLDAFIDEPKEARRPRGSADAHAEGGFLI